MKNEKFGKVKRFLALVFVIVTAMGVTGGVSASGNLTPETAQRIGQNENVGINFVGGTSETYYYTFTMPYDGVFNFTASRVGGAGSADFRWVGSTLGSPSFLGVGRDSEDSTQWSIRAGEYTFGVSYGNSVGTMLSFSFFVTPARDISWTGTAIDRPVGANNNTAETAIPLAPNTVVTGNVNARDITGSEMRYGGRNEFNLYRFTVTEAAIIEVSLRAIDDYASLWVTDINNDRTVYSGIDSRGAGLTTLDSYGLQTRSYTLEAGTYRIHVYGNGGNLHQLCAYELSYRVISGVVSADGASVPAPTPVPTPVPVTEEPAAISAPVGIVGVWQGSYGASQGETGLTLTVYEEGGRLRAIFEFYNLPGRTNAREGSYYMDVTYNTDTGRYYFQYTEWIVRASGYSMLSLDGEISGNVLSGSVIGSSGTTFRVTREGGVSEPAPVTPPPSTVNEIEAESTSIGPRISWRPRPGGVGYRVYRSENPSERGVSVTTYYITAEVFIDVNVNVNTTYYYTVQQVMQEGNPITGQQETLGEVTAQISVTTPATLVGGNLTPPTPGAERNYILMTLDNPYMDVNGIRQEIDPGRGTTPISLNGRTVVPIRSIIEAMGGTIDWDGATRQITMRSGQNYVSMVLDREQFTVNGETRTADVAPVSINERTMVPIRVATESLGCAVEWFGDTRQVAIIYYNNPTTASPPVTPPPVVETPSIVGFWQHREFIESWGGMLNMSYEFNADGTFAFNAHMEESSPLHWGSGTYTVSGNTIRLLGERTIFDYEDTETEPYDRTITFSINGNTLTITYDNGNAETYTRQ